MTHQNERIRHIVTADQLKISLDNLSLAILDKSLPGIPLALVYVTDNPFTHLLWQRAVQRLGGDILEVPFPKMIHARDTERFSDFILTYTRLASVIILNHPENHASVEAAKISPVPVIHANLPVEVKELFGADPATQVQMCMAILTLVLRKNQ